MCRLRWVGMAAHNGWMAPRGTTGTDRNLIYDDTCRVGQWRIDGAFGEDVALMGDAHALTPRRMHLRLHWPALAGCFEHPGDDWVKEQPLMRWKRRMGGLEEESWQMKLLLSQLLTVAAGGRALTNDMMRQNPQIAC